MGPFAKEGTGRNRNIDDASHQRDEIPMRSNEPRPESHEEPADSDTSEDLEAIYENASVGLHHFSRLLGIADLSDGTKGSKKPLNETSNNEFLDFVAEMNKSFDIWIDFTGALAADRKRSLDARLHSHQDISEMVVELL